ncbi:MAG: NAD-dependent epimerase/dehydratase family protein [Candidatus Riflebacteria bacterium]|nr:NAD-dependent epimerase/dehydratase family protein [Candidatus Riflebacteria bacterium]
MKILLIGGTRFVGRHLVDEIVSRGHHHLTLFNRGTNNIFPQLKTIIGDRNNQNDIEKIMHENWDVIIDTCAYFPRQVRMLNDVLRSEAKYVLISSVSVYKDQESPHLSENADLISISEDTPEQITGETYGGFKVLCEKAAAAISTSPLIIRPGLIVGPNDSTDRFTFWPYRISNGAKVLVPDCPRAPMQFIDVRDLAVFIVDSIEKGSKGAFNLVNSPGEFCFQDLIETCYKVTGSKAVQVRVSEDFLLSKKVEPWSDLPFWSPGSQSNFMLTSNTKALNNGLKTRTLEETIRDLCDWFTADNKSSLKAGLEKAREEQLLLEWESSNACC